MVSPTGSAAEAAKALQKRYPTWFTSTRLEFPDGWAALVVRLADQIAAVLDENHRVEFRVHQVKEKFGSLRFYWACPSMPPRGFQARAHADGERWETRPEGDDAIHALVRRAEEESSRTCQRCGGPGQRVNASGMVATLCSSHGRDLERERGS
jgi:hypothetical protein